ncbi:DUF2637 domain-containing protein [Micromonospora costi]|uniref:DUF2637 domain-containing protein n=1 Tax=Micromonospora costi TaxID=1530042 RepID=A0A3B0A479_9ACTN|nr:DUF2637 domain-containing protein [Micromonospora costi]RKN55293.1 DUF2637 domain-containing protein [Micromonospora costi]
MNTAPLSVPAGNDPALLGYTEARRLRRLRWAVRTVLTLGVVASIAANVLHARPHPVSQIIAAWPPLALLLTVELISRVPSHRRPLAVLRMLATTAIASIAAWVSYWHMVGVAARYGETDAGASYLLPLSVDGLVVVASISLVEIAGRIRAFGAPSAALTPSGHDQPPVKTRLAGPLSSRESETTAPSASLTGSTQDGQVQQAAGTKGQADDPPNPDAGSRANGRTPAAGDKAPRSPSAPRGGHVAARTRRVENDGTSEGGPDGDLADGLEAPFKTPAAVAYWYERDPSLHPAQIAAKIGRSERTVRRYWPPSPPRADNGQEANPLTDQLRARR